MVKNGTREELVSTISMNQSQSQFQVLAHGIITWMTKGVHLGYDRNYFTVQVDDVFLPDSRWSTTGQLHAGRRLPARVDRDDARHPHDAGRRDDGRAVVGRRPASVWTSRTTASAATSTRLRTAARTRSRPRSRRSRASFGWINHTYSHEWLGCVQDFTVVPWQCTTTGGVTQWVPQATIQSEISQNIAWAQAAGLPINPTELVTGEHSGLATPAAAAGRQPEPRAGADRDRDQGDRVGQLP